MKKLASILGVLVVAFALVAQSPIPGPSVGGGGGSSGGTIPNVSTVLKGDGAGNALGTKVSITSPTTAGTLIFGTDNASITFQGTDTYIGRATTDTLTNKTYDTAGTGNSFLINGLAATANTGTGPVVRAASPALTGSPTVPTQAATDNSTNAASTAYVTTGIANAINAAAGRDLVTAASNAVLPNTPTYNNGVSGIGATLTSASNTALVVDGYTCVLNDRILVKNQAAAAQNGIYYCSQVGTGILPWILTRAIDYDTPSDMNNTIVPVANHGTVNALTSWIMTATVATVGTDSVTFAAFTPAGANIVTAASPGAGIGHFAGSTQALTSSAVVSSDLNITTTSCSAGSYLTAISATGTGTCTAATVRTPLWAGSFLSSTGSGGGGSGGIWQIGGAAGFTTCARNVTGGVKPETCEVGMTNSASGNGQNISYVFPWDTSITQVDLAFTFFPSGTASGNFRFTGTLICQTLGTLIDSGTWTAGTVNTGATVASLAVALKTQYYTLANINIPTCAVGSPMSLLLLRDNGVGSNTSDEARLATGAIWLTKTLP